MRASVELTGRLTREPKVFENEDGSKKRALFSVACNSKNGDTESVDFIPCIMWGDERVPKLTPWMLKGRMVQVRGELRTRDIRDDDGNFVRKEFEVIVRQLQLLDKKPDNVEVPSQKAPEAQANQQAQMLALMQQMMSQMVQGNGAEPEPTKEEYAPGMHSNEAEADEAF